MVTPDPHPPAHREEIVHEKPGGRLVAVRIVNGLISFLTGLFAVVLAIHILLVLGQANMSHGFAELVSDWAASVNLGMSNLFTPENERLQVALNEGIAAILWLVIGAALTTLIARIMLSDTGERAWYRRTIR